MRQWRLIYDSPAPGAVNMAADEAILAAVSRGEQPPTLRLYGWVPPCLSLGYGQHAREVDRARLAALGWDIVRRPTGGSAILHTDELTYSVALPIDHELARGGIIESYRRLSEGLQAALIQLGAQPRAERAESPVQPGVVCFETQSHYEITVAGRTRAAARRSPGAGIDHTPRRPARRDRCRFGRNRAPAVRSCPSGRRRCSLAPAPSPSGASEPPTRHAAGRPQTPVG